VQRLFSIFPAGVAGVGLLILRLCVTGTVLLFAHFFGGLASLTISSFLMATIALALCLGAFTPVSCVLLLLMQLWALTRLNGFDAVDAVIHASMTVSLLMLGPGHYSVDARLFGRRRILSRDDNF
jgi:uncharacterized membrane protein YphA (DoxX/SURF4 family)